MKILIVLFSILAFATAAERPNFIFILADDMGHGDISSLNPDGKIPTPHLDRLAREGMTFTDAHSGSSVCTPTRYGILTGRYAWRSKLKQGVLGGLSPRLIENNRLTVASFLKKNGYHTACIGKWHLGLDWKIRDGKEINPLGIENQQQAWNVDFTQPFTNGPLSLGFDRFHGISASLDMIPYTYLDQDRVSAVPDHDADFPWFHGRDKRTRRGPTAKGFDAANVLDDLASRSAAYLTERAEQSRAGKPFFLYLPLASPHTPIVPTKPWLGKSGINAYADFVMQTDAAVGTILKTLDDLDLTDNTLVVFTADNGCSPEADLPELQKAGHHPSGPYRGHKADLFEGGHRVPFIARWPAKVAASSKYTHPICLTDWFSTCASIIDAGVPEDAAEDSFDILPALLGRTEPVRQTLIHHSINGSFAIREGKWKLLLCPDSGGWSAPRPGRDKINGLPPVQLYDLEKDPGEKQNLHAAHPDIVKNMIASLQRDVDRGRSTPGKSQSNNGKVDIWKGRKPYQPAPQAGP